MLQNFHEFAWSSVQVCTFWNKTPVLESSEQLLIYLFILSHFLTVPNSISNHK